MQLLLETHLRAALAVQLRRNGVDAVALQEWRGGEYRTAADEDILAAAFEEGRVLVTFDVNTIMPLVEEWAAAGRHHAGVIFVHSRTFPPDDIGRMLRALLAQIAAVGDEEWRDRTEFLRWPGQR